MLDAINRLSDVGFVLFVLAMFCTLVQLGLLIALATHVNYVRVHWGIAAVVLWIALWLVTR